MSLISFQFRLGVGEEAYLVLPFALERSRHDHEHARDSNRLVQEQRGGNRLDGLAKAHFVCKQRTSLPGEMERTFALVRIERPLQEWPLPVIALHLAELLDSTRERVAPDEFGKPPAHFLRNADGAGLHLVQPVAHANERVDPGGRAVLDETSLTRPAASQ